MRSLSPFVVSVLACLPLAADPLVAQTTEPCCEPDTAPLPPLPPDATEKERWLRRIHDEAPDNASNLFLSAKYVADLRADLAAAKPDEPVLRTFERHWNLALATLRLGLVDESIALLKQCLKLAEAAPSQSGTLLPNVLLQLGIAHFRDAEKQNCIANHNVDSCILPLSTRAVHQQKAGAAAARDVLNRALTLPGNPVRLESIWLLNIAHMALGTWPDEVPEAYRIPRERLGTEAPIGRFVDVARELGLARAGHAGSVVLEDLTGDGRLDVLTTKFDTGQSLRLCRNEGDGRFTDITEQAGLSRQLGGINVVQADIDGDGLLDLLVLRGGSFGHGAAAEFPNSLLRQDRPGHFTDVTEAAGVLIAAPSRTAAFADIDLDGDLDLFIGYDSNLLYDGQDFTNQKERFPARTFLNDGTGRFTDVSATCGIRNPHHCMGAVFGDIDGDGYPDLFLSNFEARNRLYMNRGDGTFVLDTRARGIGGARQTAPAALFDQDNDGDLDVFLTACLHVLQVRAVGHWYIEQSVQGSAQEMFANDGNGFFRAVTEERGLRRQVIGTSLALGDVDNDGSVDLYIGTGAHDFGALFPNVLLLNGDRFRDVTANAGVGHLQKCHGCAFGDLDDDGDLDLALSVGGYYQDDTFRDVVFRNPGNQNHWLSVELHGVRDNRFGIGGRIQVRIAGSNGSRDVYQTIGMSSSFGAGPLRAHIGLGSAERIEFVEVKWPAARTTQRIADVPLDTAIRIRQNAAGFEQIQRSPLQLGG